MRYYDVNIPDNIESCVYKLWYSDKYIIEKCKNLPISVQKIVNGLNCFIKNTPHGRDRKNLAYKFFNYILWNQNEDIDLRIEVVFVSKNPYQLLIREQEELYNAKNDESCLNISFDAYIPIFTQVNGVGSWINRGYYLNFMQWKKKKLVKV